MKDIRRGTDIDIEYGVSGLKLSGSRINIRDITSFKGSKYSPTSLVTSVSELSSGNNKSYPNIRFLAVLTVWVQQEIPNHVRLERSRPPATW